MSLSKSDLAAELDETVGPPRTKKDTRKWCKGKVGREHTPEVILTPQIVAMYAHWGKEIPNCKDERWCNHQMICSTCNKVLKPFGREFCPDE